MDVNPQVEETQDPSMLVVRYARDKEAPSRLVYAEPPSADAAAAHPDAAGAYLGSPTPHGIGNTSTMAAVAVEDNNNATAVKESSSPSEQDTPTTEVHILPPATLGLPLAATWDAPREAATLAATLQPAPTHNATPPVEATHVDVLPAWPLPDQPAVALSESSSGQAVTTQPQAEGVDLQQPGWEQILKKVPDAEAARATSLAAVPAVPTAVAGAAPAVAAKPARQPEGKGSRPFGRGIGRSGEEGMWSNDGMMMSMWICHHRHAVHEACRANPLAVLFNGKAMPSCCTVHVLMQPTGVHRELRPHLMYELHCQPCGSVVRMTRPMHLEDWLRRHRGCSPELASMNYQDFSFCKPYLQVVRAALEREGRAPSVPDEGGAAGARTKVKSRRKRMLGTPHSAPEGHEDEQRGGKPSRSSDDAPVRRVVTRRIKKPKHLRDYAALVDDEESEGPSDPDSSEEEARMRRVAGQGRGSRPSSRRRGHLDDLDAGGMSLLAAVAMELDGERDEDVKPHPQPPMPQDGMVSVPVSLVDSLATMLRSAQTGQVVPPSQPAALEQMLREAMAKAHPQQPQQLRPPPIPMAPQQPPPRPTQPQQAQAQLMQLLGALQQQQQQQQVPTEAPRPAGVPSLALLQQLAQAQQAARPVVQQQPQPSQVQMIQALLGKLQPTVQQQPVAAPAPQQANLAALQQQLLRGIQLQPQAPRPVSFQVQAVPAAQPAQQTSTQQLQMIAAMLQQQQQQQGQVPRPPTVSLRPPSVQVTVQGQQGQQVQALLQQLLANKQAQS